MAAAQVNWAGDDGKVAVTVRGNRKAYGLADPPAAVLVYDGEMLTLPLDTIVVLPLGKDLEDSPSSIRLAEPMVLEQDKVRVVLPAGTVILLPAGMEPEPESPSTSWNT